ncbi:MAG: glycosyltransferase, partial [Microbacteriaceae bacterium]|nr:glycosyltransferase [Microbacteriaceae bacterium]
MKTLVITPTYNESGNIRGAVSRLFAENPDVDLLIVDDSSPDGTGEIADELAKADKRIDVLHRKGKDG